MLDELDDPPVLDYVRLNMTGGNRLMPHVVVLPGDGIGPEVAAPAVACSQQLAPDVTTEEHLFGGASIDAHGTALTDEVLAACTASDAVLLAAVGGPKWDTTDPSKPRPEQGLLGLRKGMGLVREPASCPPGPGALRLEPAQGEIDRGHRPARRPRAHRRHLLRREDAHRRTPRATSAPTASGEIERIAAVAFKAARAKVISVDKANVLEISPAVGARS